MEVDVKNEQQISGLKDEIQEQLDKVSSDARDLVEHLQEENEKVEEQMQNLREQEEGVEKKLEDKVGEFRDEINELMQFIGMSQHFTQRTSIFAISICI